MEVEHCREESFSQCLQRNYSKWEYVRPEKFMIIELIGDTVNVEETIVFEGASWKLCSMIVFDCSHFISYLYKGSQWYLYDDNRSLMHKVLQPIKFGDYYKRGSCKFRYGIENTFFFYARKSNEGA
jgi:hypothetical protein